MSDDYICVTSILLVCGYTEWCDNCLFVVPWFSAGSVLNRVSGSLLSSRALDRGLLSSKTTYSAGGKTAGWHVFNVNIKAGTVAHHSTITISEGTSESHRQRAVFAKRMSKHAGGDVPPSVGCSSELQTVGMCLYVCVSDNTMNQTSRYNTH